MAALDVNDVFRNPRKVVAWLQAGKTIALPDGDHVFAYVIPENLPPATVKLEKADSPERKPASKLR